MPICHLSSVFFFEFYRKTVGNFDKFFKWITVLQINRVIYKVRRAKNRSVSTNQIHFSIDRQKIEKSNKYLIAQRMASSLRSESKIIHYHT